MPLKQVLRRATRRMRSDPKPANAESPAVKQEFDYWSRALADRIRRHDLELTASQTNTALVPSLGEISMIQSESKANPLVFLSSGMQAAVYYLEEIERAGVDPNRFERILEFGVGFGRILRHFDAFPAELYGCDVTPSVIDWCVENIANVGSFLINPFDPPLPFPDGHFDFVYANSVFTHLQHEQTLSWISELHRIVRKGGVVITTHYDINEHLRGYPASRLHAAWSQQGRFEWGNSSVRENNICYSPEALQEIWGRHFDVLERRQYPLEQSHLVCRAA